MPRLTRENTELAREIAVVPEPSHIAAFSFAGELGTPDVALSALVKCLDAVRLAASTLGAGVWSGLVALRSHTTLPRHSTSIFWPGSSLPITTGPKRPRRRSFRRHRKIRRHRRH